MHPRQHSVTPRTFIRELPYSVLQNIARQLDPDGMSTTWRDLAQKIPRDATNPQPKFTSADIYHFEMSSKRGKSATLTLLTAWATTNATAQDLVNVLHSMNLPKLAEMVLPLRRDMDCVPQEISHDTRWHAMLPSYQETIGLNRNSAAMHAGLGISPGTLAPAPDSLAMGRREPMEHETLPCQQAVEKSQTESTNISDHLSLEDLSLEGNLPSFSYSDLSELTSNFNDSCKLGEGAFGSVFSGHLNSPKYTSSVPSARRIAIKRLKLEAPELAIAVAEQFRKEIHIISELAHENILPLVGYSCDGPELCLVYDFMYNGSLSLKLQSCREGAGQLTVKQRVQIAEGSAAGIEYLHSKGLVHRDIKSSNILLDMETHPRISDFGLIRSVLTVRDRTSTVTTKPIGTPMYMAPEAYRGEVSTALDVFGFGLVLLELLTSMAVCDPERDPQGLDNYITEKCDDRPEIIFDLVDKAAGGWNPRIIQEIYDMAAESLNYYRKKRPTMKQVLTRLRNLSGGGI